MTNREIAESLGESVTTVENYFKSARKMLAAEVESRVRQHVKMHCRERFDEKEFAAEWLRLAEHLKARGGLEQAFREAQNAGERQPGGK
jgi:hypothetical protein